MLINTADPLWPTVRAAFLAVQGPNPVGSGLTDDQFAQNKIVGYLMNVVKIAQTQALEPTPAAVASAQATVDSSFSAQLVQPIKVA